MNHRVRITGSKRAREIFLKLKKMFTKGTGSLKNGKYVTPDYKIIFIPDSFASNMWNKIKFFKKKNNKWILYMEANFFWSGCSKALIANWEITFNNTKMKTKYEMITYRDCYFY